MATPTPAPLPQRPLPEGYYLDNFELVLETVAERDGDLLEANELEFLEGFRSLSEGARRLYVRLLSRKGPIFRRDRLAYAEVPSIDDAIDELGAAGFADAADDAATDELLGLLLRADLAEAAAELVPDGVPPTARRGELLASLLGDEVDAERLRRAVLERTRPVRLRRRSQVDVFRLLFFGNLYQDWNEFVLRDIGVVRYEAYELRRELRLFPSRRAVDDYLSWRQARHAVQQCLEAGDDESAVELAQELLKHAVPLKGGKRNEGWHPGARRLADRVFNEVGRHLERSGEPRRALAFYRAASAPPARERTARILARLGSVARALALCEEIGKEPRDESEATFARKFPHRLRRMRGEPLRPPVRRPRPTAGLTLARVDGVTVEGLALEAMAAKGRHGFFSENWLWKSLFGLAFWDVVFTPVAGAFQHPFQLGPLDLDSGGFRSNRADAVEHRLEELRADPDPAPRLLRRYDEKHGIANRLVSWHEGVRENIRLALTELEGRHLAHVFDRLSRDPGRYRRGLPDLFVLRDQAPGFELYEVKAPGDQLRPEQTAWIDYLNDGDIPASILKVDWRAD